MTVQNDNADVTPLFLELRPGMRKALADAVEAFLNLLDQIDADADLEEDNPPEDDTPRSCGTPTSGSETASASGSAGRSGNAWPRRVTKDRRALYAVEAVSTAAVRGLLPKSDIA